MLPFIILFVLLLLFTLAICVCFFMIFRICYLSNITTKLIDSIYYYNRRQILLGRKDSISYDVIMDTYEAVNKIYLWKPQDFVSLSVWLKIENDYKNIKG